MGGYKDYGPVADDFESLIDLNINHAGAMVFLDSFKEYTCKNPEMLIKWLDDSWNEERVKEIVKESGLDDEEIFKNIKLRFQDIRLRLKKIKSEGCGCYGLREKSERVAEALEEIKKYSVTHEEIRKVEGAEINNEV